MMQTPKGRDGSANAQKKVRPGAVRQPKTTGIEPGSASSSNLTTTPKDKSPQIVAFRSPRSPLTKKKRPSRISELESQVSQLQEELKTAKDQLSLSESLKKEAEEDAEEFKKQLSATSSKLEESQKQIIELSASKQAQVSEFRKFSPEQDQALLLEQATKQQQLFNSVSLASAVAEIQQLKVQHEMTAESRAAHKNHGGVNSLKAIVENQRSLEGNQLEAEINSMKSEVGMLRTALETAETILHEEQIRSTVQMTSAYEMAEEMKTGAFLREAELKAELQKAKADIEELKAELMDKENELQGISEENEMLNMKLKNSLSCQGESEQENHIRRFQENGAEENGIKKNSEMGVELQEARAAVMKAARVAEQLEASQAANSKMESELRRLEVQSEQWRKAAEAASAMLSSAGNNGKFMERTGSLDSSCNPVTGKISSPYDGEMEDDMLKKKNGNMLKKIGVLWKKPQKKAAGFV